MSLLSADWLPNNFDFTTINGRNHGRSGRKQLLYNPQKKLSSFYCFRLVLVCLFFYEFFLGLTLKRFFVSFTLFYFFLPMRREFENNPFFRPVIIPLLITYIVQVVSKWSEGKLSIVSLNDYYVPIF